MGTATTMPGMPPKWAPTSRARMAWIELKPYGPAHNARAEDIVLHQVHRHKERWDSQELAPAVEFRRPHEAGPKPGLWLGLRKG